MRSSVEDCMSILQGFLTTDGTFLGKFHKELSEDPIGTFQGVEIDEHAERGRQARGEEIGQRASFHQTKTDLINNLLENLKQHFPLNCPVTDQGNIDEHLQTNVNREQLDQDAEEQDDPLNEHRSAASETCLQSILPNYPVNLENTDCSNSTGREVFNIAPGEDKHPVSIMTDKLCEELSFPVLFPKGRFGYTAERDRKLSPIKYFNARLLHHSGKFATNPEYLFFA